LFGAWLAQGFVVPRKGLVAGNRAHHLIPGQQRQPTLSTGSSPDHIVSDRIVPVSHQRERRNGFNSNSAGWSCPRKLARPRQTATAATN